MEGAWVAAWPCEATPQYWPHPTLPMTFNENSSSLPRQCYTGSLLIAADLVCW